ncbi:MAG: dTDP-4-dehydrorhamnose 3,5-epimerase [Hyphomicrobiaceae bacterium]|nr:dTDP-4-dehydrorhamnose 3,5-epimerase [Hyphomicrobiaceae bacterium]
MRFLATEFDGPVLVAPEPISDERGFFARAFCEHEFAAHGLPIRFPQTSVSFNTHAGTVRGMHFQAGASAEAKLVRCIAGAMFDVIVDLRVGAPTFGRWQGFHLDAENRHQLFIPKGFAHGFQTLRPSTEVGYMISAFHAPDAARGFRYDDPAIAIAWPQPVAMISARDLAWPAFPG